MLEHSGADSLGELLDLFLDVGEEGVGTPAATSIIVQTGSLARYVSMARLPYTEWSPTSSAVNPSISWPTPDTANLISLIILVEVILEKRPPS